MKKVIIIGAGVAGMTAAYYCLENGFECEIIERNEFPGGNLTGWDRNGCHIDNCVHWLTGTRDGTTLNELWRDIGMIDGNLRRLPFFYQSRFEGNVITFWRNPEQTRAEMLAISPQDRDEINHLISAVTAAGRMTLKDIYGTKLFGSHGISALARYLMTDLDRLASRFVSRHIATALTDYISGEFSSLGLIFAYASFCYGNGDIPALGSAAAAKRIAGCLKDRGAILSLGKEAVGIGISDGHSNGVMTADGEFHAADYVICACDTSVTFGTLLRREYMPPALARLYSKRKTYPVFSAVHAAFSCDRDKCPIKSTTVFPAEPYYTDGHYRTRLAVKSFSYEPSFAPPGKTVLECLVFQHEAACRKWIETARQSDTYEAKKLRFGQEIMQRISAEYPQLKDSLELLDVWTPATYNRYFDSETGSFMSFAVTAKSYPKHISPVIKGLDNVFLATQWQSPPGGLPIAAKTGKAAAEELARRDALLTEKSAHRLKK